MQVTKYRAFVAAGFGYTIRVTCNHRHPLVINDHGTLDHDFTPAWQWITNQITVVPDDRGQPLTPSDPTGQLVGQLMDRDPEYWTAERLAAELARILTARVPWFDHVAVIRSRLVAVEYETTEATAYAGEQAANTIMPRY